VIARQAKKILVVDDEPSVTGSLRLILGEAGYDVLTANSFAESTNLLKQTPVDLVITDLRLSDATGIDLTLHIKANTPDIEVILMTAYGSIDVTIEAIKARLLLSREALHARSSLRARRSRAPVMRSETRE